MHAHDADSLLKPNDVILLLHHLLIVVLILSQVTKPHSPTEAAHPEGLWLSAEVMVMGQCVVLHRLFYNIVHYVTILCCVWDSALRWSHVLIHASQPTASSGCGADCAAPIPA